MPTVTAAAPIVPAPIDLTGYALAIGGAVLFSTKGIFIKLAYAYGVSTETLLALRMLVAMPFYIGIFMTMIWRDSSSRARLTPTNVLLSMAVGLLGYYVASYLDFAGLNFLSAQYERLVLFTYPFFVLLFGVWFFGDRMIWRVVPAMAISYAGLLVIFGWNLTVAPDGLVTGTALVLGSAVTFAFYQHLAKAQMSRIGAGLFTCIGMTTAAIAALGQNTVLYGVDSFAQMPPQVWIYGLCLGLICTVLPSFLLNNAIQRIGARATSSMATFGPIFTIALAVIILSEPFTPFHVVGTLLVILGSVMFSRAERTARDLV
ncbi:DMT family transporter [Devosia rhodophyticola]|uniref:DMT family transporter n=1 Tax=Devosia rhodophyticola TaxID=3026423 RepID=A0ABY7YTA4_9HYPH|nr:DMT family transporter [Devosia rhodophyticola]WDR04474.1 DMT family transporter [Devosia rhodophyticola]